MNLRYLCLFLLALAIICSNQDSKGVPESVSQSIRDNVEKLYVQFQEFGQHSSSLGLIHYYLKNVQADIEHMIEHFREYSLLNQQNIAEDDRVVITNKEIAGLNESSAHVDLDFLISTSLRSKGIYGYLLLGVYRINLANIAQLSTDPDSVITKMSEEQVLAAVKSIYLNTPENLHIFC